MYIDIEAYCKLWYVNDGWIDGGNGWTRIGVREPDGIINGRSTGTVGLTSTRTT